jgi:hypothetical protein
MPHVKIGIKNVLDKLMSKNITIIIFLKHFGWEMISKIKIQDFFTLLEVYRFIKY